VPAKHEEGEMAILEVGQELATESEAARPTETTRLLCAAAYVEPTLAQEVVEELVEEDYRAVAVPPGVDPGPVIKHCLAALGQKTRRDRLLAAIFAITLLLSLASIGDRIQFAVVLVLAIVAYVAYGLARLGQRTWLGPLLGAGFLFAVLSLALAVVFLGGGRFFLLGFLVAWAIVAYDLWRATYEVVTKKLNVRTFDPAEAPPVADPELERRADEIVRRNAGNLTVYSGFPPFASSGLDLGGWSFVVDLRKGKEVTGQRREPEPVQTLKLYGGVERGLEELGMSNLTIEDRVFVNGTDIRDDRDLLPSPVARPSSHVPDAELRRLMIAPTHRVRHYTCIRVTDWRGQLVLSLYLRFAVANGRLFCELSAVLLPPLKPELHRSDGISAEPELRDVVRLAGRSLALTPRLWLRSPSVVLRPLLRQRGRAQLLKHVKRNAFFDYGAPITALDRARSKEYSRYFQKLDKTMYVKVLERTILDSVVDVLDEHGIDTDELADRRSMIINNGIMAPSVHAQNIAVGAGAQIFNRITGKPPSGSDSGSGAGGSPRNV
jgi:hypothetical protein